MGKYSLKVDNFFIILDSSSSMGMVYEGKVIKGYSKLRVAKDFVRRINNIIPEMQIKGALQIFGDGISKQTETVYGPVIHSRTDLEQSLNRIKSSAEGNSPAGIAIDATSKLLSTVKGRNAIIFISDGERLENNPMMKVQALKEKYGKTTCFYTVWVGNKPQGKTIMKKLAGEMECGFFSVIDEIWLKKDMENFVKRVFLTTTIVTAMDSDGDGVNDDVDECPDTPIGEKVDSKGCPEVRKVLRMDSDGDGVYDDVDRCPDTPKGLVVDEKGCPEVRKVLRMDSDGDGVYDDVDWCPDTPKGVAVDGKGCPKVRQIDSDGDGVNDDVDECPDTPIGEEVDAKGCPEVRKIDSDEDGVYDDRDECPGTPKGAIVDFRGCWVIKGVKFDYKKWDILPQFNTNLDNAVNVLKKNPTLEIRIEGHTDNIGSMEYNLELSQKRAEAIKEYLVGNGINESRITTIGIGFSQPIETNETPEGRALNRRAELIPLE